MSTIKDFVSTIKTASDEKTKAYDTTATVTRIEGNTAWVHIPGGVDETPVKMTIKAKAGDAVQVRVSSGKAFIIGNATAPPTDDTTAFYAVNTAESAQQNATRAFEAAESAEQDAVRAQVAADRAETEAARAYTEAERATGYANDSLAQLGVVEDVVGTLNWISTHATYKLTEDTEVHAGKWYFTKSGNTYNVVVNPTGNPSAQGWYEIDTIDEAVANYVSSHLALTDAGLWVTKDGQAYKILLANDGMKVYDNTGHLVSTFGESITFDSSRAQYIGSDTTYIVFDPTTNTINIGGAGIVFNGEQTLDETLSDIGSLQTAVGTIADELGNIYQLFINTSYTETAVVHTVVLLQNGVDISSQTPDDFEWNAKLTSGYEFIGNGRSITIQQSDLHYAHAVTVSWTRRQYEYLLNNGGNNLITNAGNKLMGRTEY